MAAMDDNYSVFSFLQVQFEKNEAEALYDPNITTITAIKEVIEKLGYQVLPGLSYVNQRFFIIGMRCNSCVRKIESRIREIIGIREIKVTIINFFHFNNRGK